MLRLIRFRTAKPKLRNRVAEITEFKRRLSPLIAALSADIRPVSGRVFPLPHEDYCASWHQALDATGVRYRRPYNTRHSRASIGLLYGQTPAWLAKQLGHDMRTFFERHADWIDGDTDEIEMAKMVISTKVGKKRGHSR